MVFAEILLREDVPFDVVRRWDVDHTSTVINFRQLGLKVRAYFQHKSGDSSTPHGSSRVLAVALAWCLDDEDQRGRFFYLAQGRQTLADCKFVVYDDTRLRRFHVLLWELFGYGARLCTSGAGSFEGNYQARPF